LRNYFKQFSNLFVLVLDVWESILGICIYGAALEWADSLARKILVLAAFFHFEVRIFKKNQKVKFQKNSERYKF
jgi:hypothetical protein